ncbi:MAG: glycosyltransferase family 2 protein [Candidatus Shapirobacteria bacterium]|jgi:hypothetical protein
MVRIAILILNWKQPELTIQTLDSYLKIKHKNFEYKIFSIDNGSADGSFKKLKSLYKNNPQLTILKNPTNIGYVPAFNKEIKKKLDYDYILVSNNDILVDPYFLENLVTAALQSNFDILGPKIYFAPGYEYHKHRYTPKEIGKVIWFAGGKMDWANIIGSNIGVDEVDTGQHDQIKTNIDFITGCCMLVKSGVFKKIGLFDKDYFMYLEDVDFCQRAKKSGFRLAYIPQAFIWHVNSGSSSSGSSLQDYFISRNRLIFGLKYANLRAKFALIRESIKIFLTSKSFWKKQAVSDFYLNNLGKGSWK